MNEYSFLLLGGDKRQEYLFYKLKSKNKNVQKAFLNNSENITKNLEKIRLCDVIVLPIPSTIDGENLYAPNYNKTVSLSTIIEHVMSNTILFTGGENTIFTASKAKKVVNLLTDESMTFKNAMATAEATLSIIINNTERTIFGSNILIMGYGRIAKILTNYLISLKANVNVCARREIAKTEAEVSGAKAFGFDKLKNILSKYDIIINTIPTTIIKKEELERINDNTLIIDLASKPGGIDFETAKVLGKKALHALSLPGKFSPETAAEYIEETIYNTLT